MLEQSNIINALIGGTIMAISSSFHLLLEGKITGISGTFLDLLKVIVLCIIFPLFWE